MEIENAINQIEENQDKKKMTIRFAEVLYKITYTGDIMVERIS